MPHLPTSRPIGFFGPGSPFLSHPMLTPERTAGEVDHIERILELGPSSEVLDVGCGFGRHCVELAARGHRATGIDPSPAMIEAARAAADRAGVTATFEALAGEDLPTDRTYDGVLAMFTTVGQVDADDEDNVPMLARVAEVLRPGASLLIEVPQREWVVANLVESEAFGPDDGSGPRTEIQRRYLADRRRVAERFTLTDGEEQRVYDLAYRLFDVDELGDLLVGAGFSSIRHAGSLTGLTDGEPVLPAPDDPTMYVVAGRV